MKKLLLVLGVLVSSVAMAEGNVAEGRLGYSFKGGEKLTDNLTHKLVLTGEYRKEVVPNVELGLGLDVKRADEVKVEGSDANHFVTLTRTGLPVYGVAQYNFKNDSDVVPFVKGKLGVVVGRNYAVKEATAAGTPATDKNGLKGNALYAGIGAGVNYKNFVADLSYNYTGGKKLGANDLNDITDNDAKTKTQNSVKMGTGVVTLSVGYALGF